MLKAVAKALWENKINAGFGAWAGISTYQEDRESGVGTVGSIAHAGLEAALPFVSMPAFIGYEIATGAPKSALEAYDAANQWRRQMGRDYANHAFAAAKFNDTDQTFTMRERGMALAQRSRYNTQQAMLGNEAKYMMK